MNSFYHLMSSYKWVICQWYHRPGHPLIRAFKLTHLKTLKMCSPFVRRGSLRAASPLQHFSPLTEPDVSLTLFS